MADPNTRAGKRTPVTLKIKFKSETLEQFIERYAVDVSQGGIFIRTKEPLAVGTQMRFEFQLKDASPLIGGEGTVVWTRENDPSRPAVAPGMGVRFDRLAEGSQVVLERILAEKAKQAPHRPASESIKPPLFTDTPTRVAPAPVTEQLLGGEKPRRRPEDEHTPLPKPVPFHSDADEFPDEAFEEATKVRALDELVAQTAELGLLQTPAPAAPEQGAGRAGFSDVESIPGLPSPPEASAPPVPAAKPGRLLDATPSPRTEAPPTPPAPPADSMGGKTKLGIGLEAPRMQAPAAVPIGGPGPGLSMGGPMAGSPRAVAAEPTAPVRSNAPARGGSSAPLAILILIVIAAAAAGVWFFVLRDRGGAGKPTSGSGSDQVAAGSGSAGSGSAPAAGSGSSQVATGSGSAKVEAPKAPVVETVIEANVPKAQVEIVGTDQRGDAPFTAKLEKDKPYKVRVSAAGHAALELDVVGGAPKQAATLVPKPRIISLKTEPAGALISIDGVAVSGSKLTPYELELTKQQAAKKYVRIRLFKTGYKLVEKTVQPDAFTEDDARMIATIDEKLQVQAAKPPTGAGSGSQTGGGTSGDGSAAPSGGTGTPPGDGSAAPPPPPPPPPAGGGTGEAGPGATP